MSKRKLIQQSTSSYCSASVTKPHSQESRPFILVSIELLIYALSHS